MNDKPVLLGHPEVVRKAHEYLEHLENARAFGTEIDQKLADEFYEIQKRREYEAMVEAMAKNAKRKPYIMKKVEPTIIVFRED